MNKKLLSILLAVGLSITPVIGMSGCVSNNNDSSSSSEQPIEKVDYASKVQLDFDSDTLKCEATVKTFIDGDTTHFYMKSKPDAAPVDVLKARYLAVNTPESTGKLEEWGKKAAKFTRERLEAATSIVLETNGNKWETDSTGERYLVWVWYKTAEMSDYRCVNIELLQEGLAVSSKAGSTRYGEICTQAINQANVLKLHVFSNEQDPDFYYGNARPVDIKEVSLNTADYTNTKVSFEGYVAGYYNNGVYVQNWDEETQRYYGMYIYYGFFLDSFGREVLNVGNYVRIVGNVQYYEAGGTYQVSDLSYDGRDTENPEHIKRLDKEMHPVNYTLVTLDEFNSTVTLPKEEGQEEARTATWKELALNTAVELKNLKVIDAYTTNNGGDNDGAISLTCQDATGKTITVRTVKLFDENMQLVPQSVFLGKTIDVKGIVEYYKPDKANAVGSYQIKLLSMNGVTIY